MMEATPGNVGFALDLISNIGALGFVFWLVSRTFSHTIPRLATDFRDAIKDSREDFKETLREQRDTYTKEIGEQRVFYEKQITAERKQVDKITDAIQRSILG